MELTRREFLKIAGWTGLAFTSPFPLRKTSLVEAAEKWLSEPEQWVPTTCLLCPGRCGVLARVVEGYVVKLEGNPQHPINQGGLCPVGQAALHMVHHPDRIPGPMKRSGARGGGKWESIEWRSALDEVASRLKEIREENKPHTVAFMSGGLKEEETLKYVIDRLMRSYGSPNHFFEPSLQNGMPMGHFLTQGIQEPFAYDIERAHYILSFGASLLENWHSPSEAHRLYGYLRQGRPGPKAKFVQIEPRFSVTAAKSDQWVPIRPGTYGALALGIATILIKEGLYDKEFIEKKTFGFEGWVDENGKTHEGFKDVVLKTYKLDYVSEVTDVPISTLLQLARDFAHRKPAIAIADSGATSYSNGVSTALAIHCLNTLAGNIDSPGGVLIPQKIPFTKLPPPSLDKIAEEGLSQPRLKSLNEIGESPYPLQLLFLYRANPLFSALHPNEIRSAFGQIPFIVSFSSYWDETTLYADLVLPDATFLEKWQDAPTSSMSGLPIVGLVQPVARTSFKTMPIGEGLLTLAHRIGGTVEEAFPWKNFQEVLEWRISGVFEAKRGVFFTAQEETTQVRLLEERGWWVPPHTSLQEFWEGFKKQGGWWDPYYPFGERQRVYQTSSKKFEFFSKKAEGLFENHVFRFEKPYFEGDPETFPFYLIPFHLLALSAPEAVSSPWLLEILSVQNKVGWDSWAEIHPKDASTLGIRDGDWVWLVSPIGQHKVRARLYEGIYPKTVCLPFGLGHGGFGRYAKGIGVNPNDLIPARQEKLSGLPIQFGTRVQVRKA